MKQAISKKTRHNTKRIFIALILLFGLPLNSELFSQCSGFSVVVNGPPIHTYCPNQMITLFSSVTGGTAPYNYVWSLGGVGPSTTIQAPNNGTYNILLTVTDANGCVTTATFIVQPVFHDVYLTSLIGPICEGQGTMPITANAMNADSYVWSNGETTSTIFVSTPGIYSVTFTNFATGCTFVAEMAPNILPAPSPTISGTPDLCEGVTGMLITSGGPFASYAWAPNGENTPNISISEAGIYSVTVTDFNGCTGEEEYEVFPLPTSPPVINAPPLLCAEESGIIEVVNQSDYVAYNWNVGQTTPSITGIPLQTYEVTVTDFNGCTQIGSVVIGVYDVILPSIIGGPEICLGQETVDLMVLPTYPAYEWSTSETTETITVSDPGIYSITVTDFNGCTSTGQEILQPAPIPDPSIPTPSVSCSGDPVSLIVNGGPYSFYDWSNGETEPAIMVDQSGNYAVTVTNASGCTGEIDIDVNLSSGPVAEVVAAPYACNGSLALLAEGSGTYEWSNGETTDSITVMSSGTYTVTVTDAAGCTATAEETVSIPALPQVSITGVTALCAGTLGNLTAGNSFDEYLWSNGETMAGITVSLPGTYTVTATDVNGCTATASQSITVVPNPEPEVIGPAGFCGNGSATLSLSQPFSQIAWSNGEATQSTDVSQPDTYTVTVTDAVGCTGTDEWPVTQYVPPAVAISGPTSICSGSNAVFSVSGSFSQINWSNGETTPSINGSTAGNYQVTVTDVNGCTAEDAQELEVGTSLTPDITTVSAPCDIDVTLDAGGSFNSYLWSNGSTAQNITVTANGTYSVTVSDGAGCTGEGIEVVMLPTLPTISITGPMAVCEGETATLIADGGFSSYSWSNGETAASIDVSQTNNYSVTATDANGCTAEANLIFGNNPLPSVSLTGPSSICTGSTASLTVPGNFTQINWSTGEVTQIINVSQPGIYSVTVTDGNGCTNEATQEVGTGDSLNPAIVYSGNACDSVAILDAGAGYDGYLWSNGETSQNIVVASNGNYAVTVSNGSGCSGEDEIQVTVPALPQIDITGPASACENETSNLTASPGFVSYEWSNGQTTDNITVSQTGTYGVTATDNNGCTASASQFFDYFPTPDLTITGPGIVCAGSNAELAISGNFTQIIWSNGATADNITISQPGTYTVTATDANGCTAETSQELLTADPPAPLITASGGPCDSTFTLDAGNFDSYLWSNGSTGPIITAISDGQYSVTVSNASGCTGTDLVDIAIPNLPTVNIAGTTTLCDGDTTVLAAPGNFTQHLWNTGEMTPEITVTQGGIYSVTVTDANGCTATDGWVLTQLQVDHIFVQEGACSPQDTGTVEIILTNQYGCDSVVVKTTVLLPNVSSAVTLSACEGSSAEFDGVQVAAGAVQTFTYNASNGCDSVVTVSVLTLPPVAFGLTSAESCWNAADGTIQVSVQNGTAPYQYALNSGGPQQNPEFTGLAGGLYTVTVSDAYGCTAEQAIEVSQTEPLGILAADEELDCENGTATLQPMVISGDPANIGWLWSDGSTAPSLMVDSPGNYALLADDGCMAQEFTFHVEWAGGRAGQDFFYIPNGFSPNSDGINDEFRAYPGQDFEVISFELLVFDRWGDMMFGTADVAAGWDGTNRGQLLQPGVFAWYVKAKIKLCGGREMDFFREGGVTIVK